MPRFRESVPSQRQVVMLPSGVLRKDADGCVTTSDATSIHWLTRNGFVEVAEAAPSTDADAPADDATDADAEADATAEDAPKPTRRTRRKQSE